MAANNLAVQAYYHAFHADVTLAMAEGREAMELAQRSNTPRALCLVRVGVLPTLLIEMGRPGEALAMLRESIPEVKAQGFMAFHAHGLAILCKALLWLGRHEEVAAPLAEAIAVARESRFQLLEHMMLGLSMRLSEDRATCRAHFETARARLRAGNGGPLAVLHFYSDAIEAALALKAPDIIEGVSALIDEHNAVAPLEWTHFLQRRGQALAAYLRGVRDPELKATLTRLRDRARDEQRLAYVPALDAALAGSAYPAP
jgi:hypothetical protein